MADLVYRKPRVILFRTLSARTGKRIGVLVLLALVSAVPAFASDFQLFRFTMVLVYAIALLGLNILTGYNGQISLGHGAFYTLGAYSAAILISHFGIPHWLALPIAGGVCLIAGILFALPAVRLEGVHLALATLALAAVTPQVANYKGIERWTGGSQGLGLNKPDVPFGLPLSFDQWMFLLTLFVLVLLFVIASNLLRGRIGRAIVAIRDHSVAAESMGIHTTFYKTLTFGISTMYTGIAGALSGIALLYVSPASIFVSLGFLVGIAVGGIASLSGAIYGAIFLQVILLVTGAIAESVKTAAVLAIYGVVVIAFLHLMPAGVAGLVAKLSIGGRRRLEPDETPKSRKLVLNPRNGRLSE
jgi:branched-chain amino acid transport system permease protein